MIHISAIPFEYRILLDGTIIAFMSEMGKGERDCFGAVCLAMTRGWFRMTEVLQDVV